MGSWTMNRNVSTVDYNISRFFIQMRTRDRVTSACQRWWLWTTVTGDVVTQGQSSQGRRGAGVHGSTPYRRLATSAVSVALAKAAQAGVCFGCLLQTQKEHSLECPSL